MAAIVRSIWLVLRSTCAPMHAPSSYRESVPNGVRTHSCWLRCRFTVRSAVSTARSLDRRRVAASVLEASSGGASDG